MDDPILSHPAWWRRSRSRHTSTPLHDRDRNRRRRKGLENETTKAYIYTTPQNQTLFGTLHRIEVEHDRIFTYRAHRDCSIRGSDKPMRTYKTTLQLFGQQQHPFPTASPAVRGRDSRRGGGLRHCWCSKNMKMGSAPCVEPRPGSQDRDRERERAVSIGITHRRRPAKAPCG